MTTHVAEMTTPRLLNQPSSHAPGRHRSNNGAPTFLDTSVIEQSWAKGEPALPFSPRQATQHWYDVSNGPDAQVHAEHGDRWIASSNRFVPKGQCMHSACQRVLQTLIASQDLPTDPTRALDPYRTYNGRRGDAPSQWITGRRAGVRTLSLDKPMGSLEGTVTLADSLPDSDTSLLDDTAYVVLDPEIENQIEMERSIVYSGSAVHYRRKMSQNTGADFVAIDRWGSQRDTTPLAPGEKRKPIARIWQALAFKPSREVIDARSTKPSDFEVCYVFEAQQPLSYPDVRDAYIDRIIELTGEFPTYEEQRRRARAGAQARLERQQTPLRVPIDAQVDNDPFRYRALDAEMHEPHEIYDLSSFDVEGMAAERFTKPVAELREQEIAEIEEEILADLKASGEITLYTQYVLRGHRSWHEASEARLHSNGAEYLASGDDVIEGFGNSITSTQLADLIHASAEGLGTLG